MQIMMLLFLISPQTQPTVVRLTQSKCDVKEWYSNLHLYFTLWSFRVAV
jgi:hypothetical protein